MNRTAAVMSRSADDSCHGERQFHSVFEEWLTNPAIPNDEHLNVTRQQYPCERLREAPCVSLDFVPPFSMQIPNSVANARSLSSDCRRLSCPSAMPHRCCYQKPEVVSTSYCAARMQAGTVSQSVAATQASMSTLCYALAEDNKCCECTDVNKFCDTAQAAAENNSGMPGVDLRHMALSSLPDNCTDRPDTVLSPVATQSLHANDTTVTAVAPPTLTGPVTPRPKCGRAKTNAELKRQLMERREQRLRDMMDNGTESIVALCTRPGVMSGNECRQLETSTVVVRHWSITVIHLAVYY